MCASFRGRWRDILCGASSGGVSDKLQFVGGSAFGENDKLEFVGLKK